MRGCADSVNCQPPPNMNGECYLVVFISNTPLTANHLKLLVLFMSEAVPIHDYDYELCPSIYCRLNCVWEAVLIYVVIVCGLSNVNGECNLVVAVIVIWSFLLFLYQTPHSRNKSSWTSCVVYARDGHDCDYAPIYLLWIKWNSVDRMIEC